MGRRRKETLTPRDDSQGDAVLTVTVEPTSEAVAPPREDVPPPCSPVRYVVADGKSFCTARGVRGPGAEVVAEELAGGAEYLAHLCNVGYVVKK